MSNLTVARNVIRLRRDLVHFDCSRPSLDAAGIAPVFAPRITGPDLLRLLALRHRNLLLATDDELRRRLPPAIPQLLQLDEWRHPDIMRGEAPSDTACFRSLAEALAAGDGNL